MDIPNTPAEWPKITVQTVAAATTSQLIARSMGLYQHRIPGDTRWEMQSSLVLAELERRSKEPALPKHEREAVFDSWRHLNRAMLESIWG